VPPAGCLIAFGKVVQETGTRVAPYSYTGREHETSGAEGASGAIPEKWYAYWPFHTRKHRERLYGSRPWKAKEQG